MTSDWRTDSEYEDHTLTAVRRSTNGYELGADGAWLYIEDPGFEPQAGDTVRYFGRGFGYPVRGVVVLPQDGGLPRVVRYRTAVEEEQHHKDSFYPPTAREALAKWDSGDSIFTVSMGGLGPGYEQVIHVAAFEMIRDGLELDLSGERQAAWMRLRNHADDVTMKRIDGQLGMSGAQYGAALNLAFRALVDGWQAMVMSAPDDRRIQVSNSWPMLLARPTATASVR